MGANLGGGNVSPPIIRLHPPNIFMPRISELDDFFFGLHYILGKKLVTWEVMLFFLSSLHCTSLWWAKFGQRAGLSNLLNHPLPNLEKWQKMVNFAESSPQCSTKICTPVCRGYFFESFHISMIYIHRGDNFLGLSHFFEWCLVILATSLAFKIA